MTQGLRPAGCVLLIALGACAPAGQSLDKITPRDVVVLQTHVQTYLDFACGSLDCHGADGRPLRLYSELGRRADASLRPVPVSNHSDPVALTQAELDANCAAFAALALGSTQPDQQLALLKPLAASAGGINHVGGVHWQSKSDPGYLCLRGWLVGDITQDVGAMCAAATAALQR